MSAEVAAVSPAILIVEDEFLVRLFAVDALEDAGFRVLQAETAAQALQVLRAEPGARAAIIDIGLPDRPGDQLAAEVQALRPHLPMVIASGRSGRELRERFAQQARVAILVKPYTAHLLLEALAEVGVTPSDCGSARPEDSPA
jgi:DNA-binding NtrC family response regulator